MGSATAAVSAGIVEAGGRKVGVVQLSMFDPHGFPSRCDDLLADQKLSPDSPCDEACRTRLSTRADAMLVEQMQGQLRAVAAERPEVLLVDIAENGGGNDSAIALARMVTDRRPATPRVGFVRTQRWTQELANRQAQIRAGLAATKGDVRTHLQRMDAALSVARAEAGKPCDRAPLWRGETIACSLAVTAPLYAGGLAADELAWATDQPWAGVVSSTTQYPATQPIWRGPLLVLLDGNAASASELFAAMLQDSGSAVLLGSPSFGAGCGHMMEPDPVKLTNSGASVSMPDCLRLRADGRNEVSGVEPDVLIGFRTYDTPRERAQRLARALPEAFRRLDAKAR